MRTFTVITTSVAGKLVHEIYDFFIPKEHDIKSRGWYLPFGDLKIPLGERDIDKLLQTSWKKIPCPSRDERKWQSKLLSEPLICPKCSEKFGKWRKYTIGFECFHPNQGEVVLSDKVVKNAFCLKLRDQFTKEYNGKFLLVAPDKEQEEALVYWKIWDHELFLPTDRQVIAKEFRLFDDSNFLLTLEPGSSILAVKVHEVPANYILKLTYDGNQIQVIKNVLRQEQDASAPERATM